MADGTSPIVKVVGNLGERLSTFTQRWIPDSWVVCMILTVLAILLAMAGADATLNEAVLAWGGGMWQLLELAMQFSIAMIAAHACVSSRPVFNMLDRLANLPDKQRPAQAVFLLAVFSMGISYLNWALSLVASALFVPFVARRNPRADIRVLIAAAYLGVGTIWHGGLSGSAPLILATPGNPLMEPGSGEPVIDRLIPVTESLFNAFNLTYVSVLFVVALVTVVMLHPRENPQTMTDEQIDRIMPKLPDADERTTPARRMEAFPGWVLLAAILIGYPLGHSIVTRGFGASGRGPDGWDNVPAGPGSPIRRSRVSSVAPGRRVVATGIRSAGRRRREPGGAEWSGRAPVASPLASPPSQAGTATERTAGSAGGAAKWPRPGARHPREEAVNGPPVRHVPLLTRRVPTGVTQLSDRRMRAAECRRGSGLSRCVSGTAGRTMPRTTVTVPRVRPADVRSGSRSRASAQPWTDRA